MKPLIQASTLNALMLGNFDQTISVKEFLHHADTGIGIEQKHIPRLCERFYRVDKSHSKSTGGTGLGLAIVKHICSLYDAKLYIQSKPDKGTTVTVSFPKKDA